MADQVANISKGRLIELYNRVEASDPANAVFIFMVLATTGLEADDVFRNADNFTAVVAGTTNEVTNAGYARIVFSDADLAALPAPDDANDRYDVDLPDLVWGAITAGDGWSKIVWGYCADSTAGTGAANNANIVVVGHWDFVQVPNGSAITAVINAAGAFRAA